MKHLFPGTRVLVFDWRLYKNDKKTPINETLNPATVKCWYGCESKSKVLGNWKYRNLIDVEFDHRPGFLSKSHIADSVRILETEADAEEAVREVVMNAKLTQRQEIKFRKKLLAGIRA